MAKYSRSCEVCGREGRYYLVQRGPKNSRVLKIGSPETESELVSTVDLQNIQPVTANAPPPNLTVTPTRLGSLFRLCHEDLKQYCTISASWDWFVWFAINNAFGQARNTPGGYQGDVFKDRDDKTYPECSQEEHWVAHLFHAARQQTAGVLVIDDEPIWLLGFQWPNQGVDRGRRADLVGITTLGGLVVLECKLAGNAAEPPALGMVQALDYLSHLCRQENFAKIVSGFQLWRNKPGQMIPERFQNVSPNRESTPTAVVLAPRGYYEHHRQTTGLPGYLSSKPVGESVRMRLASCDFSEPKAHWWPSG